MATVRRAVIRLVQSRRESLTDRARGRAGDGLGVNAAEQAVDSTQNVRDCRPDVARVQ